MIALIKNILEHLIRRGSFWYLSISKSVTWENISIINSFNSQNTLQETTSTKFLWTEQLFENPDKCTELKNRYEQNKWGIIQIKNFLQSEFWIINIISDSRDDTFYWLIYLLSEWGINWFVINSPEQMNDYINSSEIWLVLVSNWFYQAFRFSHYAQKKKWKIIIISDTAIKDITNIILVDTIQENTFPSLNSF